MKLMQILLEQTTRVYSKVVLPEFWHEQQSYSKKKNENVQKMTLKIKN